MSVKNALQTSDNSFCDNLARKAISCHFNLSDRPLQQATVLYYGISSKSTAISLHGPLVDLSVLAFVWVQPVGTVSRL